MPVYGSFKYGEGKYGAAWQLPFSAVVGSYRGHRFTMFMTEDGQTQIHDKSIDSDTTVYLRYLINGLIMKFDPAKDHILIYSPLIDDLQAGDNSNFFVANLNSSADFLQLRGADFLDGRELKWDMGMIPFDVSLLNSTSWDDSVLTDSQSGFITINDYPAGSYRAFVYATGTVGTEDGTFTITGALGTSGVTTMTNVPTGGEYYYVDFVADELDDITFTIVNGTEGTSITLGDLIIFPLSNNKNFPLNVRDQALRLTKQKLRGAEK
ncbi:hypothetical protein KAR91_70415 [Candidatus Pacearchaeota archaeon]|nr:hypothetical protein [Candidatus Pacearchaeota archaeon]